MVIEVTDKAKEKLQELISEKESNKALRIYIAGYGWGGPSFGMALEEPKSGDLELSADGFNFLVEEDLKSIYGKFTIDYSDSWLRKGFLVYADGSDGNC